MLSVIETIRQIPVVGDPDNHLVHVVTMRTSRGYNGTDYLTQCRLTLLTGQHWAAAQYEIPTCIRCLGTHV